MTREEFLKGIKDIEKSNSSTKIAEHLVHAGNYIKSLEQQNTALQARIKELEYPKTCDECLFWKDYRKCPMADHEDVAPKNYCYNFYPKDTK